MQRIISNIVVLEPLSNYGVESSKQKGSGRITGWNPSRGPIYGEPIPEFRVEGIWGTYT